MKIKKTISRMKKRVDSFLNRRPHRSFKFTRRRDYVRSLKLPGYISFTRYVWKKIWSNRKIFIALIFVYILITVSMVGFASQDVYSSLVSVLQETGGDVLTGFWGKLSGASLLLISSVTGGISQGLTEVQQLYSGFILLMMWLTCVWILRNKLAGRNFKLRDAIYNAGSPIIPTILVSLLIIIQLLPIALAFIAYNAALVTGILNGGVEAMLFWVVAGLMVTLSLYWLTSTFFALIIITLPGMYPMQAIKTAGDLVTGRRLRILYRLLWLIFVTLLAWIFIMIPVILIDMWIKNLFTAIVWVPIVPLFLLVLGGITIIWISSYIYLLYRKVVDDESESA